MNEARQMMKMITKLRNKDFKALIDGGRREAGSISEDAVFVLLGGPS